MTAATGLTRVPTDTLVYVLRMIHRGALPCPLTPPALAAAKLQHVTEDLDLLRGLDTRSVIAVLVAVIAERRK